MKAYLILLYSVFISISVYGQLSNNHIKARVLLYDDYWEDREVKYLDSAYYIINAAIKEYPDNIELAKDYLYLARRYSYHDSFNKAENILNRILNNYPKHWVCAGAYNVLGEVYMYQGDTVSAIKVLSESYNRKWPCDTAAWDNPHNDSLKGFIDRYIDGQYLVSMLIKEKRYEEALHYHNIVAEILKEWDADLCGTVSGLENSSRRLRYFEIYSGLGDTLKAAKYIIEEAFKMHWTDYCKIIKSNPYKRLYKLFRNIQSVEQIREEMINSLESIKIQYVERAEYYIASSEVYNKKVILGAIYNNGDVVNNSEMNSLQRTLTETELLERVKTHYLQSCLFLTFTGNM